MKHSEISLAGGAPFRGLPERHRLVERGSVGAANLILSASLAGWLRSVSQRERDASMSLIDVHSAATAGTAKALIAAEATRTGISS